MRRGDMSDQVFVEAWFPLKAYILEIRYRVLSELGELSHFILEVMSRYGIQIDGIETITGLRVDQILPVLERLKGLGFIDKDNNLTPTGERAAYILSFIHNKKFSICLDQHYHRNYRDEPILFANTNTSAIEIIPDNTQAIKKPSNISFNHSEDSYNQAQRLKRKLSTFLSKLIPDEFDHISEPDKKMSDEWEIRLSQDNDNKNIGIKFDVPFQSYRKHSKENSETDEKNVALFIYTPLIILNTELTIAEGLECKKNYPQSYFLEPSVLSEIDGKIYNYDASCNDGNDGIVIPYSSPAETEINIQRLMDDTLSRMNKSTLLYSRKYSFESSWQAHKYTYKELISYCNNDKIHKI